jgi:hypothetical protein
VSFFAVGEMTVSEGRLPHLVDGDLLQDLIGKLLCRGLDFVGEVLLCLVLLAYLPGDNILDCRNELEADLCC